MRIIVAPQEFKGTLTAREAAETMAAGARRALPDAAIEVIPLSDGGPGLVDTLVSAAGSRIMQATVQDPLGRPVEAEWGLLKDGTAVIEIDSLAFEQRRETEETLGQMGIDGVVQIDGDDDVVAILDGGVGLFEIAGEDGSGVALRETYPARGILAIGRADDRQLFGRERHDVGILGREDG